MKIHNYNIHTQWTGNIGDGTSSYNSYSRNHKAQGSTQNHALLLSSDSAFRGDPSRYNPEELLLVSVSSCHMLWYLHLCAKNEITVTAYEDTAQGKMKENNDGSGQFEEITLYPIVTILESDKKGLALSLHEKTHHFCFIANSCNFKIKHEAKVLF